MYPNFLLNSGNLLFALFWLRSGSKSGFTSSQEYPSTCVPRSETVVVAKRGARKHTLRCPLGLRQPEIYWYIGGVRLDVRFQNKWQNLSRGRVRYGEFEVLRNGNLRVHDVTSKHEGRYYCQARPKAGSKRKNMPCSTIELRLEGKQEILRINLCSVATNIKDVDRVILIHT